MPAKRKGRTRILIPRPPCEPRPPRRPPDPEPTRPWDVIGGPDLLKWLKLGKKRSRKKR